jgi:hypothetical protein
MSVKLEHANITVPHAKRTAELLIALFDWKIRWEGASLEGGYTVHVGGKDSYLALYSPKEAPAQQALRYHAVGALNHIGFVVEDLDAMEQRIIAMGYRPHMHADYEPGRRFYFYGPGGVEYELVSYA